MNTQELEEEASRITSDDALAFARESLIRLSEQQRVWGTHVIPDVDDIVSGICAGRLNSENARVNLRAQIERAHQSRVPILRHVLAAVDMLASAEPRKYIGCVVWNHIEWARLTSNRIGDGGVLLSERRFLANAIKKHVEE